AVGWSAFAATASVDAPPRICTVGQSSSADGSGGPPGTAACVGAGLAVKPGKLPLSEGNQLDDAGLAGLAGSLEHPASSAPTVKSTATQPPRNCSSQPALPIHPLGLPGEAPIAAVITDQPWRPQGRCQASIQGCGSPRSRANKRWSCQMPSIHRY